MSPQMYSYLSLTIHNCAVFFSKSSKLWYAVVFIQERNYCFITKPSPKIIRNGLLFRLQRLGMCFPRIFSSFLRSFHHRLILPHICSKTSHSYRKEFSKSNTTKNYYIPAIGSRRSKVSGNIGFEKHFWIWKTFPGFEKHFRIWKTFSDLKNIFEFENVFRIWKTFSDLKNIFGYEKHIRIWIKHFRIWIKHFRIWIKYFGIWKTFSDLKNIFGLALLGFRTCRSPQHESL